MGYETELLIGKDTDMVFEGRTYFQLVATIDMCKLGESALFNLPWVNETPEERRWEWYPPTGDGDTSISVDRYDSVPRPIPLIDVLEALEEDIDQDDYRRLKWAYHMLRSMHETSPNEFSVMLWGY